MFRDRLFIYLLCGGGGEFKMELMLIFVILYGLRAFINFGGIKAF